MLIVLFLIGLAALYTWQHRLVARYHRTLKEIRTHIASNYQEVSKEMDVPLYKKSVYPWQSWIWTLIHPITLLERRIRKDSKYLPHDTYLDMRYAVLKKLVKLHYIVSPISILAILFLVFYIRNLR